MFLSAPPRGIHVHWYKLLWLLANAGGKGGVAAGGRGITHNGLASNPGECSNTPVALCLIHKLNDDDDE